MYATTKAKHQAIAYASAQLFSNVHEAEYRDQYPSQIDFLQEHLHFITLTFNPENVSVTNHVGFSTGNCFYQSLIDDQATDPWQLSSMEISQLVGFAKRHKLDIDNPHNLTGDVLLQRIKDRLEEPILQRLARNPNASLIGNPILQRPLVDIRPKPNPLNAFEHLHRVFSRKLLGNNIQRKLRYQPIAFAYMDFEGTSNGASVDPATSSWPHVHAVMFVRPQHANVFELVAQHWRQHFKHKKRQRKLDSLILLERERGLTADEQSKRLQLVKRLREPAPDIDLNGDLSAIHDFDCQHYDASKPLGELLGYCSKGADQQPVQFIRHNNSVREAEHSGAHDLFQVFPTQLVGLGRGVVGESSSPHERKP